MKPDFSGKIFEFQGDTLGIERRWPEDSAGQTPSKLLPSSLAKYGFIVLGEFCTHGFRNFWSGALSDGVWGQTRGL